MQWSVTESLEATKVRSTTS